MLENVNLRTQTCDGGQTDSQVDASSTQKAISVQHCSCTRKKENNTETNLRRLVLGGQTVKNLRSLACKYELGQSERKSSQVHASHGHGHLFIHGKIISTNML